MTGRDGRGRRPAESTEPAPAGRGGEAPPPPRPQDAALRHPRLPSLTGLRWVAAFLVLGYHVRNTGYFTGDAQTVMSTVFGAGTTGVSLFFLLSGFVLTWADRPDHDPAAFWRRRIARVYPLHVVTFVLALIIAETTLPGIRTVEPPAAAANLVLVSSWNHDWWQAGNPVSWTLVCEAFFYLTFPVAIRGIRRLGTRPLVAAALATTAITIVGPVVSKAIQVPEDWFTFPLTRLPEFLLGVVLARLLRTGAWSGARTLPAVALAVAGYAAAVMWAGSPSSPTGFTVVGFALLLTALARSDMAGAPSLLATRPLVALGEISFAFYLVHLLVLQTIATAFVGASPPLPVWAAATLALCAVALALIAATVLHQAVELPGRRLILLGRSGPPRPA